MGDADSGRQRGSIRTRGNSLQVRMYAGPDPVTGRDTYLTATIKGTDKVAHKRADDKLAEFRTQVLKQRNTPSSASVGFAIDEWMRTIELEDSTRDTYRGYIEALVREVKKSPGKAATKPEHRSTAAPHDYHPGRQAQRTRRDVGLALVDDLALTLHSDKAAAPRHRCRVLVHVMPVNRQRLASSFPGADVPPCEVGQVMTQCS